LAAAHISQASAAVYSKFMRFIIVPGWEEAADRLAKELKSNLSNGQRVLWLVSGGSNVQASVQVMNSISDEQSRRLSVMPVDERYGPPGHADSNWAQLLAAGFESKSAQLLPVLKEGQSFEQATDDYSRLVETAFAEHDIIVGQLGIGDDGHIAGILPHSPAVNAAALATGYESPPYKRLTLTFSALLKISTAYALVFGGGKQTALNALKTQDLALDEQPAQILKQLPEAYIYNDQVGDDV
jgi:6-phosphogluconolactonase/glucosamine-6-phosphate isomerase/deaminase